MSDRHRVTPGSQLNLQEIPTGAAPFHDDRKAAEREFEKLRERLQELQHRLYSEGRRRLLIVLQAMDAGGKDGTIRKVFEGVNPQGVRVTSFKGPSKRELAHDYLWRVHRETPARGMIRVFNRSHYEDVLIVRVANLAPEADWSLRYDHINDFERLLSETGTTILKFYLHISKEEQRERMQARIDNPEKRWKFAMHDLEKRRQWQSYQEAYEAVLERCSTTWAPWYAIPGDDKWYRNLAIARVLVGKLDELDPQYPPGQDEIDGLVVT